jgi:hypothetical protein
MQIVHGIVYGDSYAESDTCRLLSKDWIRDFIF